jgi:3-oxoacyl-[acyl-carrier protein] reductase
MMDLEGKVVLVTGGGTGIGKASALMFAKAGASVAVNYSRSRREAEETARELGGLGVRSASYAADIADEPQVKAMFAGVRSELGPVSVLVNNAGRTRFVAFPDLDGVTDGIWDEIFDTNVRGTFYCCRQAASQMKQLGEGVIVNVSSVSGYTGYGSSIPYAASKAALLSLNRSLALALAPEIRVNAVAPGTVDTRWLQGKDEYKARSIEETPMGRITKAEDVAEVIFALATSAGFVTGQCIVVDGGRRM